ncbi:MAG: hypothetical protein JO164_02875 [Candidatus Eremiobacteraeota bacterium]|nr:hypothetical protein [Candidatus Eremiobacteraeota bacterium]
MTSADPRNGKLEQSLIVRADGPIDGVTLTPTGATCTLYAGVRAVDGYDPPDVSRPELVLTDPQSVEPVTCKRPYLPTAVTHAFEPMTPGNAKVGGTVRIGLALDEHGKPLFAHVISSPGPELDAPSVDAAIRSEYTGAVFRCKPVSGSYAFAVNY